jgi:hypothetical protein
MAMEQIELQIANLRKELTAYLKQVCSHNVSFIIKKRQKAFAVLAPYEKESLSGEISIECSLRNVRAELADLVNKVYYNNLQVVIRKHKAAVAILKPLEGVSDQTRESH